MKELSEDPTKFQRDCIVLDEGDTYLVQEVNQHLGAANPRHVVLLSAVPRATWTPT